jgi:hypothetical protein
MPEPVALTVKLTGPPCTTVADEGSVTITGGGRTTGTGSKAKPVSERFCPVVVKVTVMGLVPAVMSNT